MVKNYVILDRETGKYFGGFFAKLPQRFRWLNSIESCRHFDNLTEATTICVGMRNMPTKANPCVIEYPIKQGVIIICYQCDAVMDNSEVVKNKCQCIYCCKPLYDMAR